MRLEATTLAIFALFALLLLSSHLPVQLSDFFEAIEASKADLAISDYSISQTTLEQVFISFVNNS
jgi:hypothetical protein